MKTFDVTIGDDSVLIIPDEITKELNLHEGDIAHFNVLENGAIEISFKKFETVTVDLPNETLFQLMLIAHERNVTLNQLCEDILREEINKSEKRIFSEDLEDSEKFDEIMDNVSKGTTYLICEDKECTKPSVVLMPTQKYKEMKNE